MQACKITVSEDSAGKVSCINLIHLFILKKATTKLSYIRTGLRGRVDWVASPPPLLGNQKIKKS